MVVVVVLHGSRCDGTGRSPTVGFNGRYWHPAATSNSHSDSRIKIPLDADRGKEKRRVESLPPSLPPPCESAPVWHCGQFQSTRCGVSITRLAGRADQKFSSQVWQVARCQKKPWKRESHGTLSNNDAHHCSGGAGTAVSRKENLLTGRHSALRQWHPADLEIIPTVFRSPFRHFKSSSATLSLSLGPFCGKGETKIVIILPLLAAVGLPDCGLCLSFHILL